MEKLKKLFKEFALQIDIINALVGIVLIVSLVIMFINPNNKYAILVACMMGGFLNILNGLKLMKDPKKRMTGTTYLMLGGILIVLGFVIIRVLEMA